MTTASLNILHSTLVYVVFLCVVLQRPLRPLPSHRAYNTMYTSECVEDSLQAPPPTPTASDFSCLHQKQARGKSRGATHSRLVLQHHTCRRRPPSVQKGAATASTTTSSSSCCCATHAVGRMLYYYFYCPSSAATSLLPSSTHYSSCFQQRAPFHI